MDNQVRAHDSISFGGVEHWLALVTCQAARLLTPANLATLVISCLAARTALFLDLYPFGIALFAAILTTMPGRSLPAAAGILLGVWTREGSLIGAEHIMMTTGFAAAYALFSDAGASSGQEANSKKLQLRMAMLVITTYVLVHGPYSYMFGGDSVGLSPYKLFSLTLGAATAGISAVIFNNAFSVCRRRHTAPADLLAPAYLLAVAVAGLSSIKVGPAHIQNVVGGLALLSFAWVGGPGIGAAAGVVVGSIGAQGQLLYPPVMGKLALAGLAAGYARRFGRWGTAAGFLAANLALTYYLLEPSGVTAALWETIGAVLAFLAVPTGLLEGVTSLWGEELQQFIPTVERANQDGPPPEARTEEQLSEVAERLHQFSGVFEELSRSFEEVSPAREEQGTTHDKLIELAVSRACRECRFFERCWEDRFYHTYQGVLDLLTELELGEELNKHRVLDKVDSCHRAKRLGMELAQAYEYRLLEQRWAGRVDETRGIVATQLHGASEVMKELALEVEQQEQNGPVVQAVSGRPRLSHVMGVSRRAKQEGSVSGDSYLVRELPDGRWAFMLSDGMGAGPKASRESKTTIDLLYRLLEAGFSPKVAVKTINSVLLFRSAEDVFATIDLVLFDVHNSTGEFVKVGAAPSFLKRGTRVTNINARTLPVGILNDIEVEVYHRALRPGDVLVLLTDGILNSQGKGINDRWVKRFLRSCSVEDVQQVARSLVKRAQQFSGPELVDDLTALVFKFE